MGGELNFGVIISDYLNMDFSLCMCIHLLSQLSEN